MVPYGRIIRTVHNVNLNLHRSRQGWVAPVFGHRLQLVRLALRPDRVYNKREQKTTALVSRRQGPWQGESAWYMLLPVVLFERGGEEASLSLESARQSLADALLRLSANAWKVLARARARIMHAPSCQICTFGEVIAKALAIAIAIRGSRTVRAPGDERRDGRSTIRNLYFCARISQRHSRFSRYILA